MNSLSSVHLEKVLRIMPMHQYFRARLLPTQNWFRILYPQPKTPLPTTRRRQTRIAFYRDEGFVITRSYVVIVGVIKVLREVLEIGRVEIDDAKSRPDFLVDEGKGD